MSALSRSLAWMGRKPSLERLRRKRDELDRIIAEGSGSTGRGGCCPDTPTYQSAVTEELQRQRDTLDRLIAEREVAERR